MSAIRAFPCECGYAELTETPTLCACHRYWLQGRQLASVSSVLRSTWPIKPDFSAADPDVVEHARERGSRIDEYFCRYLAGESFRLSGEWKDVAVGLQAVIRWWESEPRPAVRTQVVLHDDEIAGTADIVTEDGCILDLKCVSRPEPTYALQLGAYLALSGWKPPRSLDPDAMKRCGLIHCAFSKGGTVATVKRIDYDADECLRDWLTLREMWGVVRRRTA